MTRSSISIFCQWTTTVSLLMWPHVVAGQTAFSPDDPASLQRGIDAAAKAGQRKITIPPGVYRTDQILRLSHLSDLEIDAAGVTLLRTRPTRPGVEFDHCARVTLRGLTIRCETFPFTQGQLTALDPAGECQWFDLKIDAGYPANFDDPQSFPAKPTGYVFDPATRQWKAGTGDFSFERVERREVGGPGEFRLHLARPYKAGSQPIGPGDLMAFRGNGAADVRVADCEAVTLTGVTILAGSGFCVHESGGEGRNHYSYALTYGPTPAGATAAPLIASNADAFHSGGVRHGPTLEDCHFEGMCDDGIPIHGYYALIVAVGGDQKEKENENEKELVIACPWDHNFFRPGDPLRLFDPKGALAGEANVTASETAEGYRPPSPSADKAFHDAKRYYRLTLDRPLPAASVGCRISDPAANGSGFVVRHCVIRNHRARGLLIKADDGLIEDNLIDGSTIAALLIAPEYYWNEACYSRNVIVRNNTFRHAGYASTGSWNRQAGAVTVEGEGEGKGIAQGHQHLIFENNLFQDNDGVNLLIDGAQDVLVKGNHFIRPGLHPTRRGADRKIDPASLIFLTNCQDVRLDGNTVTGAGEYEKTPVAVTPTAVDVKGREDGVK